MLGSPALPPGEELHFSTFLAMQNYRTYGLGSTFIQSLTKCPDLSIPFLFHIGVDLNINATCAEYFEPVDHCSGIECKENASCISKGNSFECSCNDGYAIIKDTNDTSGNIQNKFSKFRLRASTKFGAIIC